MPDSADGAGAQQHFDPVVSESDGDPESPSAALAQNSQSSDASGLKSASKKNLLAGIKSMSHTEIRDLIDGANPDGESEINALNALDKMSHNLKTRKIRTDILGMVPPLFLCVAWFFVITSMIIVLSMFLYPEWSKQHQDVIDIYKFGWTVTVTVLIQRFSSIVFNEKS